VLLLSIFLVVWVYPSCLLIKRLGLLNIAILSGNLSLTSLQLSIRNYLLATDSFLLDRIGSLFFLLLLFHHLLLPHLLGSLEVDLINLVWVMFKSLEVVWLDSVRSKHAYLSCWVFTEDIVVVPVVELDFVLMGPLFMSLGVGHFLFLGEDAINMLGVHLVLMSLSIMLALGFSENLIMPEGLLIKQRVNSFFELLLLFFFSDLLLAPILLL